MNISGAQRKEFLYFINKIVTFIVPSINRSFDEGIMIDYFVGRVIKVDECGIWYEHIKTNCKNFIFYDKIISIAEEKIVEIENEKSVQNPEEQEPVADTQVPENVDDLLKMFQN